jgi:signal peptidase
MRSSTIVVAPRRSPIKGIDKILTAIAVGLGIILASISLATVLGQSSWLIERSDSMAPYLKAGDLLAVQRISPADARPGDVVTFKEPSRPGILLTHRVVSKSLRDGQYEFVTRGDANTGSERWTVKSSGTIGRLLVRVPKAGKVVSWLGQPPVRFLFLTVASLLLAVEVLRRIWSSGAGEGPGRRIATPIPADASDSGAARR